MYRILAADGHRIESWVNGAGSTRVVAVEPPGEHVFDWRISVATVTPDASFSVFPEVDRILIPLHEAGFSATVDGVAQEWPGLSVASFSGDSAVRVTGATASSLALNLMVRRGRFVGSGEIARVSSRMSYRMKGRREALTFAMHLSGSAELDGRTLQVLDTVCAHDGDTSSIEGPGILAILRIEPNSLGRPHSVPNQ